MLRIFTAGILPLSFGVLASARTSGAGYDTSRVGPENANCDRKAYELKIESNATVFDDILSSSVNEVLFLLSSYVP